MYIEDQTVSFSSNVLYKPIPPGKRAIYQVDELSGGEKTMAALALLFAFVEATRPPFIVLDEADAFLDKENVDLLSKFITTEMAKLGCQCIIISHKIELFHRSENLIGTTFQPDLKTSKLHSLSLKEFE